MKSLLSLQCAHLYLALGRLQSVKELIPQLPPRARPVRLAVTANLALLTDHYELMLPLEKDLETVLAGSETILALARCGRIGQAEAALRKLESVLRSGSLVDVAEATIGVLEGEIARARGDKAGAVTLLRESLDRLRNLPLLDQGSERLHASESLSKLLEEQGQAEEARRVLEAATGPLWRNPYPEGPHPWVKCRWLLGRLSRRLGEFEQAEKIEKELLEMLAYADADHPFLVEIRSRSKGAKLALR